MKFQEPKAEFVPIDLTVATSATVTSQCDQVNSKKGSVETCTGPDAPQNLCCDGDSSFAN